MSDPVENENPNGPEGEATEVTGPEGNNWWVFNSKEDAIAWGNKTVTERLARERKNKLDPVVSERDTLKAEVERLKPFEAATQTDSERRDKELKALNDQIAELRSYKQSSERSNTVRSIADELGLPSKFIARVQGDDEDSIRADITDLLNVLSEGGSNTKKAPASKAPKESEKPASKQAQSGGGGEGGESDDSLTKDILEAARTSRANGGFTVRR